MPSQCRAGSRIWLDNKVEEPCVDIMQGKQPHDETVEYYILELIISVTAEKADAGLRRNVCEQMLNR